MWHNRSSCQGKGVNPDSRPIALRRKSAALFVNSLIPPLRCLAGATARATGAACHAVLS